MGFGFLVLESRRGQVRIQVHSGWGGGWRSAHPPPRGPRRLLATRNLGPPAPLALSKLSNSDSFDHFGRLPLPPSCLRGSKCRRERRGGVGHTIGSVTSVDKAVGREGPRPGGHFAGRLPRFAPGVLGCTGKPLPGRDLPPRAGRLPIRISC